MAKAFLLQVKRPDRICWGCDRLCPALDMACGNAKGRTEHPSELFGDDWYETGLPSNAQEADPAPDVGEANVEADPRPEEDAA